MVKRNLSYCKNKQLSIDEKRWWHTNTIVRPQHVAVVKQKGKTEDWIVYNNMLVKHFVHHLNVSLVYILICYVISGALLMVFVILFSQFWLCLVDIRRTASWILIVWSHYAPWWKAYFQVHSLWTIRKAFCPISANLWPSHR